MGGGSGSAALAFPESSILAPGHLVVDLHLFRSEESSNPVPGLVANLSVHPGGFLGRFAEGFPSRLHDLADLDFLVRVQIQSPIQVLDEPGSIAAGLSRLTGQPPPIRVASGMEMRRTDQGIAQGASDKAARQEYEGDPEEGLSSIRQ